MLANFKSFEEGHTYEIDAETAAKWCAAGVAEQAEPSSVIDEKLARLEKTIEERDAKLIETITKAVSVDVKIPAVAKDHSDKSFGDFLNLVAKNDKELIGKKYGQKAQNTQSGEAGGYLIPTEYADEILSVSPEEAIVRPRANVHSMVGNTKEIPALQQTTNLYGGVLLYYREEGLELTESQVKFRNMELHVNDLTGLCVVTNDMLADGPKMDAQVVKQFRNAAVSHEDKMFLVGSGIGCPLGVQKSAAAITVQRTTAAQIKLDDALKMQSKLHPECWSRAIWVAHISAYPQIAGLKDGAGNLVYHEAVVSGGIAMFQGRPIYFTGKVPTLGTQGDLMLFDPSLYQVGTKGDIEVSFSDHFKFANNSRAYRFVLRHDGQNGLQAPVVLDDGTTQVSNVVLLTDAA